MSLTPTLTTILKSIAFVIGANILGHILPPFSLAGSPVYMPLIIAFTCRDFFKNHFFSACVFIGALLLLNDLLIRLYAGGSHDSEGKGWCAVMYFFTQMACLVLIIVHAFEFRKTTPLFYSLPFALATTAITVAINLNFNMYIYGWEE